MSHAVVFSDPHLNNWNEFSRVDPTTGLNTRLLDGVKILQQIRDYCTKHKIKYALNGGDLLHKGAIVSADLLELLVKELFEFKDRGIEFITVIGQHDFLKKDGSYNLPKALSGLMTVLNDPGEWVEIEGVRIIGCSYRYGLEEQKEALKACDDSLSFGKNILLGHFLLREILEQNAAPFDTSDYVSYEDLPKTDLTLLGDYHFHATLRGRNVLSIGAAAQHQWGDKNRPQCGFLDLDLNTMTFKRIEVDSPLFITIGEKEDFPGKYSPHNFYNVIGRDQREEDKIRAKLSDEWNVKFTPVIEEVTVEDDREKRLDVKISMEPHEVVRKFVEYFGKDERFLRKGLNYL